MHEYLSILEEQLLEFGGGGYTLGVVKHLNW